MKNTDPNIIDYNLLNKAIKFFSKCGFRQIETPWRVSKEAINATFNSDNSFATADKFLVGSAEQGFLEIKNTLQDSQYMSVSPCFRNELEDYFLQQEFIKLELIILTDDYMEDNMFLVETTRKNVVKFIIKKLKIKSSDIVIVQTNDENSIYSEDILINGIEYGSYGIRQFQDLYYIYGTGIALPRASKILKYIKD